MEDEVLRVGIIGIGWWALTVHAPRLQAMSGVELSAISRRNAEALSDAQQRLGGPEAYTDWRDMLDRADLDAVIVATSHHAHVAPTIEALKRGLHVLVEKPMALASEDAWAMVGAAERADRVLMVGYNRRCIGRWRAAARALRDGALGQVRQLVLNVDYNLRWFWDLKQIPQGVQQVFDARGVPRSFFGGGLEGYWRRDPNQMGGGTFADFGTHYVDLALWLGGAPPVEVVALAASAGLPVETHLGVQARLANDVLVSLSSADGVAAEANHLTIYGDAGTLIADWTEEEPEIVVRDAEGETTLEGEGAETTPTAAFIDTIRNGAPNLSPARDGAHAVAFTEAVYRSIDEGSVVQVALP
jgi:predicted dehydrogenase